MEQDSLGKIHRVCLSLSKPTHKQLITNRILFRVFLSIIGPVVPVCKDPKLNEFTRRQNKFGEWKQNEKFVLHMFVLSSFPPSDSRRLQGQRHQRRSRKKWKCAKRSLKTEESYLLTFPFISVHTGPNPSLATILRCALKNKGYKEDCVAMP